MKTLCIALLAALLATGPAGAASYSAVYAFGDSLTDAGNDWTATRHAEPFSPPYSNGRFSNGPVWAQDIAAALGLPALKPSLLGGTDYAFGGAQTGATGVHTLAPMDLPAQLAEFALNSKGHAPSSALYLLSIGGNDMMAAVAAQPDTAAQAKLVSQAASNAAAFVAGLAALGARHIAIMNVPDLGHVPAVDGTAAAAALGTSLASQFNAALAAKLLPVKLIFGAKIATVNAYALLDQAIASPAALGFANVTKPCWTGGFNVLAPGTLCAVTTAGQDKYLFWDSVHPTEHGHAAIAALALTQLP